MSNKEILGMDSAHAAAKEMPYCSNMSISANLVVEMVEHIAELEDLAQMIIDAESADPRVILLMYNAWLLKAKSLKGQE